MSSSLALVPPVAASVTAAAVLLAHRGPSNGCGCPAWRAGLDPDSAPVSHEARCPLGVLDDVFGSFSAVGHAVQAAVEAGGGADALWRRVAAGVRDVDRQTQVHACVAYALALVGAARVRVRVQASLSNRAHDLDDLAAEKFAVMDHITRSDAVALGPETIARLLLSTAPDKELPRTEALLARHDPAADTADVTLLFAATARAVNNEAVQLSRDTGDDRVRFSLPELASDGFNLLVGIRGAGDVSSPAAP